MLKNALKVSCIYAVISTSLLINSVFATTIDDANIANTANTASDQAVYVNDDNLLEFDETLSNVCTPDQSPNEVTILSYHEITSEDKAIDTTYAVSPENFAAQMQWLHDNGYHFVSIDDVIAYKMHHTPLPTKAVMITFDDGYRSVYDNAWPVLKKFHIPFVDALVGSWLKVESGLVKNFDKGHTDRNFFLSQTQLKEMLESGLLTLGSHTFAMHDGTQGNPQGNLQPAVTTRQYSNGHYESEINYKKRITADLKENNDFLKSYTGHVPKVVVWPYGRYNIESRTIAAELGMPAGLTLDDGSNTVHTPLWGLRRVLVEKDFTIEGLKDEINFRNANSNSEDRVVRAAHIDLDYIYDPNPEQEETNLSALLDRLQGLGVNTVYLQAFADADANGAADAVYFPNPYIPMKQDLFNRVAWQIQTRTPVSKVYAWMPLIAWELPKNNPISKNKVVAIGKDGQHLNMGYPRLSPFSPEVRELITKVYQSLGRYSSINGVLFHDDITLSDFEDDSPWARAQYKKWGLPSTVAGIRADKKSFARWTNLKIDYLDRFANHLAKKLATEQPGLKTARNLYAQVALNPNAPEWYAQSLSKSIRHYDFTAIMAMPYMEQAKDHKQFYKDIVDRVKAEKCGVEKTVMELQTVDWRKDSQPLPTEEFTQTIRDLYDMGINHIAYYPDNVFINNPNQKATFDVFAERPYRISQTPKNKKG
ncbi:polysaccharide deacetylase [Pelistega indica]|uniref:Polysaccharide deacetylase n=1 Tax=Pelistega indica TaxID=1414851 RepID=V8G7X1_9BURK|nr:poly-beta-1,6-N-acetyl-D-glucosamine N-deacetylase PgaB [Pelistega indica]ETD72634.1 polysaccharide deacetylase [Pelistega indica]